ncbi:MAG: hypothetical protein JWL87_311 [Candidatus Adlerbacteria bacterium]|nr:hypothetical protein [Candidatus Adlerbacteria bacterium]
MRTRFLALATLALSSLPFSAAQAADVGPGYKSPAPAAFRDRWEGFYIGATAGYGFGNTKQTATGFDLDSISTNGPLVGITAGANWMRGNIVWGFETDLNWAGFSGNSSIDRCAGCIFTATSDIDTEAHWFGTTRGRLGYSMGSFLPYITAGIAYGGLTVTDRFSVGGYQSTTTEKHMAFGPAFGAGVEWAIGNDWSAKIEYLHIDLNGGSSSMTDSRGNSADYSTKLRENIVRAGLNFRF